jgi:hypothetical protein
MKLKFLSAIIVLLSWLSHGQGTFVYDQQSSTDETFVAGGGIIQDGLPGVGQSFTPTLSGVGFVRLSLYDWNPNNGIGATLSLNLRTDSITGAILATTPSVSLPDSFSGFVNFYFPSEVPVTSGGIYAFEILVQSGSDSWSATAGEYSYAGGTAFSQGMPVGGMSDFWFREGIVVVPEPSSAALLGLGALVLFVRYRFKKN